MLAPVTHILPFTLIRRARLLPIPGKVIVRAGQKVNPTDTIAEANLNADYLLFDIARGLGLSPEAADRQLKVKEGENLAQNDVLAGPVGMFRRVMRTPRDGRVMLAGGGQVLIETVSKPFQLKAGLAGQVMDLIPDRGAVVEGAGALIQGVWGNGQTEFGVLTVLAQEAGHVLSANQLDVSMRGAIVVAGQVTGEDVLRAAEELPLRGLILSSVGAGLIEVMQRLALPIILLEGFGSRPFNPAALKLLVSSDRREAAINAAAWNRYEGVRPEIIIPMPASAAINAPPESSTFEINSTVRIRREPFAGATGVITAIKGPVVFPGGLRARAAEVRLDSGSNAVIPLANLEVIA